MDKKTMGTLLSALRRAQGLTQQEVADRLVVSNRAVSRWERDEAAPDITLLPAIADLFGVTVDELLRGERKRIVEESAPSPNAGDTPPASPTPDPRALRGARALCRRTRSRFETFVLIAVALVAAGYVAQLGIVYGLERVYIGNAVLCLCCVGSVVLSILGVTLMRDTLREQAPDIAETRLPDADLAELVRGYARGHFAAIITPPAGVVLSLPLVLYKKGSYFGQAFMMDGKDYLLVALLLSSALTLAGWLAYRPFQTTTLGTWATLLDIPAPPDYMPARRATVRRLNLWQGIAAVAGLGGGLLLDMLFMSVIINGHENDWPYVLVRAVAVGIIFLSGVLLPVIFLIRTYRRLPKDDRTARRHVLLSGVRNVIVSFSSSVFWTTGITYVSWGFNWRPELLWTPQAIAVWICATLAIFAITELLRRQRRAGK